MTGIRFSLVFLALGTITWAAAQDVLTYHNDNARTGQNLNETILNTSNVNVNTFGKLFILPADGKVDAEPLYVSNLTMSTGTHNVVFVATEHDSVYAYDTDPGALLLLDNIVYMAWSSHCDDYPYTGWIMGYDERTLAQTRLLNITPNGDFGSVWQSGAGPAADTSGNIYFLAANGTADTTLNAQGFPSLGNYGNAFMKLSTNNGRLVVADYLN